MRPVAACRARLWIREGRLAEAQRWTQSRGITADDELHYLTEFEHLTRRDCCSHEVVAMMVNI